MTDGSNHLNFSQRNGLEPMPEQLKLEQVSGQFRRLVHYALDQEIDRVERMGTMNSYFDGEWKRVAQDFHVKFLGRSVSSFENAPFQLNRSLENFVAKARFDQLFNLIEFFANHIGCSTTLKNDLAQAFVEARTAYRLKDNLVIAVGTGEQAEAVIQAIEYAEESSNLGARQHLVAAAKKLTDGDWVGSVRDSIHAVEAVAVNLAPEGTLGAALSALEKDGKLHGGLKKAFGALYGYTSDKNTGVRHANVFGNDETVDETDALFMLGACASFVSYLIAKNV
ncbi:AbiJ-NTD4 domain-containing protein [Ruegeria sp. HKCCA5426]|uniref:AbiJ-NTD4 domain-containing protein n=1 Tax=Ruegeria sp. HKCCA5426 TaxID=2682985 RepID=UPI001488F17A|nr:hypothetical protein [Ruegeria sp. HKCCA5426]